MAVNESRSMNGDLQKGAKDGLLKSLTPDRGGEPETAEVVSRAAMLQRQYNITDATAGIGDPEEDGFGYI